MGAGTVAIPSQRFDAFAQRLVESGRYTSASEVLEAAIDALEREECDDEAKEAFLQEALDDADASGIYEGDAFAAVRREMGWETEA